MNPPRFAPLPLPVLENPSLSPAAKLTYAAILFFCGRKETCWPAQETIAKSAALSKRHIRRCIQECKDHLILEVTVDSQTGFTIYRPLLRYRKSKIVILSPRHSTQGTFCPKLEDNLSPAYKELNK